MKHIILLRHASAVHDHAGGDFNRPLSSHGITQVQTVAHAFLGRGLHPELALASPAMRTRQTAELLAKHLSKLDIITDHALYLATGNRMLDILMSMPDDIQTLLLVGHNPGISELAANLDNQRSVEQLPTAGFVACQLRIHRWRDIPKTTK